MTKRSRQAEQLKHTDGILLSILGLIIIFGFLAFLNQSGLESVDLSNKREKLFEFLDNQKTFDRFLKQKEQIYWDLNRFAWMSVGDTNSANKHIFVDLFYNAGPGGWDEEHLESRYSFKALLYDFFINDFDYWNSAGENKFKLNWPSDTSNWSNRHSRLKQIINDDTTINYFFASLVDNKVSFLKSIIATYDISVKADLLDQIPDSIHVIHGHSLKNFINFLNDSTGNTFHITGFFRLQHILRDIKPQKVHDMYNWICQKVFDSYIREKFSCYDTSFYSVRTSYTAYMDKMSREKQWLDVKLKNPPPSQIQTPTIPLEMEKKFFNLIVLWLYALLTYLANSILTHRFSLSALNVPTIISFLVYPFTRKNFSLGCLTLLIIWGSLLCTVFVNLKSFHVLYESHVKFCISFLVPALLVMFVSLQMLELIRKHKT